MYELVQTGRESYYFSCPSKIGLWVKGTDAYLIDSGNDKDAGKKVLKTLEEMELSLKGILITHYHADHIGGCNFLQEKTGCDIYVSDAERSFVENPMYNPSLLYGAYPPSEFHHKLLLAKPSKVSEKALPEEIEYVPLPGHSLDMRGYKTPDGTLFLADSLSSKSTLEKYSLTYSYNITAQLETLDKIKSLSASVFVPSHAEVCQDPLPLVELNKKSILSNCELILSFCKSGASCEEILEKLFSHLGLTMTFEQNVLCHSTLRAYLSHLAQEGKIKLEIKNNRLIFTA